MNPCDMPVTLCAPSVCSHAPLFLSRSGWEPRLGLPLPYCVLQMFKGPDKDIEFIYTAPSSAVCGVSLDVGGKKEYLIAGE